MLITALPWLMLLFAPFQLNGNQLGDSFDQFSNMHLAADCYVASESVVMCDQEKSFFRGRRAWMRAKFEQSKLADLEFILDAGHDKAVHILNEFTKKYGAANCTPNPIDHVGSFICDWTNGGQKLEVRFANSEDTGLGHDVLSIDLRYTLVAANDVTPTVSGDMTILATPSTSLGTTQLWSAPQYMEIDGPNGMLVQIQLSDGKITYGNYAALDDAAKAFWNAVGKYANCANQGGR